MFSNYLKIATRSIIKNKSYSFINIAGLAFGLAIFSLIASFVDFHFSFDKFHKDADQIYSVIQVLPSGPEGEHHTAKTPPALLQVLLDELSEIEDATRWIPTDRWIIRHKENKFYAEQGTVWAVDSNFFSFFSFEMVAGDPTTALSNPRSVVITESTARKYFGNEDPIGQKLSLGALPDFLVTGVAGDVPLNSSMPFDLLISMNSFGWERSWRINCATFIRLADRTDPETLMQKRFALIEKHGSKLASQPKEIYFLPLSELYLESSHIRGLWRQESQMVLYLTLLIGIVLLIVVCFNFVNLATAHYFSRAKEVGVRKALGSTQQQLRWQFIGESVLLALFAFPLALVLCEVMHLPFIYLMADYPTQADLKVWRNPLLLLELIGVTVFVGILAGSYPAVFLSRLQSVQVLKGGPLAGKKGARLRRILVVAQFVASIFAVLVALTTFKQYKYLSALDVGFNKDKVLIVELGTNYHSTWIRPLKEDLLRHPDIVAVSAAVRIPVNWNAVQLAISQTPAGEKSLTVNAYGIDYGFIELLEMDIIDGRSFSPKHLDDANYIINETAARELKWKYPVGQKLTVRGREGVIVGVVKDFHFKNLYSPISPSVLYVHSRYLNVLYIKLSDASVARVRNFIENRLQFFEPDLPLKYTLLNERFSAWLSRIQKWATVAGSIGVIAIFFSCLGLVGLASYATQMRLKEIGIRKAHGATMPQIMRLLLLEFLQLIVIANIIAWPMTFFILRKIMQQSFAYVAHPGIGIFIIAGATTILAGLLAVTLQTIKAAAANPVDALRYQ